MSSILGCTPQNCIDSPTAIVLFGIVIGCFALGYGIGQAVLWTRRISEVA